MAATLQRRLSLVMVWTAFYEQLAWTPVLVILVSGDRSAVAWGATAYSLSNMLGNSLFGLYADRFNRDRVAGLGLLAMTATTLMHLAADTAWALVGVRFAHGLAASALAPAALARVSDSAPDTRQGESAARVGLIIALASMVSPPVTGIMARSLGIQPALGALAGFLLLVGAGVLTLRGRGATQAVPRPDAAGQAEPIRLAPVLLTAAMAFAIMFGQNVLFYAFQLRTNEMGMDSAATGWLLSAFAVGAMIAFVPPLSRMVDRWGPSLPISAGMVLTAIGLWGLAVGEGTGALAGGLFVYGLGFGLAFTAVTALGAVAAGQRRRSLAFGMLTAAFSAGAIVGPVLTRALDTMISPFLVAAIVALLATLLYAVGKMYRSLTLRMWEKKENIEMKRNM